MFEEYIQGRPSSIPFAAAAELHHTLCVGPRQPEMTKEAAQGVLKVRRIMKIAQTPEEAQAMLQQQAMTDPSVVAALDQQEIMSENQALQETVEQLQGQVMQTQQAQQASDQQAQELGMQMQQQQALLDQAQAGRQAAQTQAVAAQDQAMQEQVTQQQNRQQLMQAADQLSLQLKQVAAQPTMSEQQQAAAQQQQAAQQQAAQQPAEGAPQEGAPEAPPSAKTQKEEVEAVNSQQEAEKQTAQVQQAKQQDAAKIQVTMQQPQQGQPQQGQPKQASDRMVEALTLLKEARLRKEAKIPVQALYTAGGATIGAGIGGAKQLVHQKRYGKDKPSNAELELIGDLTSASMKAKREPTYVNKMRVKQLKYRLGMEKTDREHPGGAVARGAFQGAVVGALAGPSFNYLGKKGVTALKAMKAAKAAQAAGRAV